MLRIDLVELSYVQSLTKDLAIYYSLVLQLSLPLFKQLKHLQYRCLPQRNILFIVCMLLQVLVHNLLEQYLDFCHRLQRAFVYFL